MLTPAALGRDLAACMKHLTDVVEYAGRYADLASEPAGGDCRRTVQRANAFLDRRIRPQPAAPHRFSADLLAYVERYAPPGHFLGAVLRNDLAAAVLHGSADDLAAVPEILAWLHARGPLKCWGSAHAVAAWVANYDDGLPF